MRMPPVVHRRLSTAMDGLAEVTLVGEPELLVSNESGTLSVRVRATAPGLLDVWLEHADGRYLGPFEVDDTDELDDLVSLAKHVVAGTAVVRWSRTRRRGRGKVTWDGSTWTN